MSLKLIDEDISKLDVDVIVNAANRDLLMGGGVCGVIFRAAGPEKLQNACDKLSPINTSESVITPAFNLKAKYIIHTAGPIYKDGNQGEEKLLRNSYLSALELAKKHSCKSIAFPLISAGIYGYPKKEAIEIACRAILDFLKENEDMEVYLILFNSNPSELKLAKYI
jgi:O-acetyl-ADP-ribose deacetylase (regulator of RNase III)